MQSKESERFGFALIQCHARQPFFSGKFLVASNKANSKFSSFPGPLLDLFSLYSSSVCHIQTYFFMTVTDKNKQEGEIELGGGPSAVAQPVSSATLLDPSVAATLQGIDSFYIQQKLQWKEVLTLGCWEQPNVYTIMDKANFNKPIMVRTTIIPPMTARRTNRWPQCML